MGTKNKVEICFEIGHSHNGNIRFAKKMLNEVKKCGGTLAKIQLYDIDKIMTPDNPVYWDLKMGELNFEEAKELKDYADEIGIELFASAFDSERVQWCYDLGFERYKLASRSIYDTETIKAMEATGKPIIVSLGMWKLDDESLKIKNAEFLYCVAEYPAIITEEIFPKVFHDYLVKNMSAKIVGFSDHTIGIKWAKEAIRRGATIIEKHFTLDKRLPGCDQSCSATPEEMLELVKFANEYGKN